MVWHQHPLNLARESRGDLRVNALWMWGMSSSAVFDRGTRLFAESLAHTQPDARTETDWQLIDTLTPLALAEDWSAWLAQMQQMEAEQFAPALAQLSAGALDELRLVLSDGQRLDVWSARRSGMRKFWLPPSLSRLAS
jgi:hypothetical protein